MNMNNSLRTLEQHGSTTTELKQEPMHEQGIEHQPDEHHINIATTMLHTIAEVEEQDEDGAHRGWLQQRREEARVLPRAWPPFYTHVHEMMKMPSAGDRNYAWCTRFLPRDGNYPFLQCLGFDPTAEVIQWLDPTGTGIKSMNNHDQVQFNNQIG